MRTLCPVCGGSGEVPKNLGPGTWGIWPWPTETCQNCWGMRWIGDSDISVGRTDETHWGASHWY